MKFKERIAKLEYLEKSLEEDKGEIKFNKVYSFPGTLATKPMTELEVIFELYRKLYYEEEEIIDNKINIIQTLYKGGSFKLNKNIMYIKLD